MNETQNEGPKEPSVTGIEAPDEGNDKYYDQPLVADSQPPKFYKQKTFLGIAGGVIIVVAIIGIAILHQRANSNALKNHVATVDITAQGFQPATVIINKGQSVKWVNYDDIPHQPATDPFPLEDGLPGFRDPSPLTLNQSYTYTFSQSGTFTYHDHLDPFQLTGKVVVH